MGNREALEIPNPILFILCIHVRIPSARDSLSNIDLLVTLLNPFFDERPHQVRIELVTVLSPLMTETPFRICCFVDGLYVGHGFLNVAGVMQSILDAVDCQEGSG